MKRPYEEIIGRHLAEFPCVAILGPRQCGKTTLLGTLPSEWRRFDLERQSDFEVLSRDPDLFLRMNPRHIAIDESQLLPALFPALRVAIDEDRGPTGRFVITGSSSPSLLKSVSESLAGRVALVEMAPFSFAETRQAFHSRLSTTGPGLAARSRAGVVVAWASAQATKSAPPGADADNDAFLDVTKRNS